MNFEINSLEQLVRKAWSQVEIPIEVKEKFPHLKIFTNDSQDSLDSLKGWIGCRFPKQNLRFAYGFEISSADLVGSESLEKVLREKFQKIVEKFDEIKLPFEAGGVLPKPQPLERI